MIMERREVGQQIDSVLLPFLQSIDETDTQRLLERLVVDHAEPIIKNIISHKMHVSRGYARGDRVAEDAEEMHDGKNVTNFRGYVAAITYSAWHDHLRRKYPQRHLLKNRLRYLLSHRTSFAVWESEDKDWLCGLAAWSHQRSSLAGTRRLQELRGP